MCKAATPLTLPKDLRTHTSGVQSLSKVHPVLLYDGLTQPGPLENDINEIFGSKREDPFSDPFFRSVPKYLFGSFFVPVSAQYFL